MSGSRDVTHCIFLPSSLLLCTPILLEVRRRMLSLTSKIDYFQKGTFIRENINWLLESGALRIKESGLKREIKARKCC